MNDAQREIDHQMDQLHQGLRQLRVACDAVQIGRFRKYLEILGETRGKLNLVSAGDFAHLVTRHFLESLLVLPWLPAGSFSGGDLGAGAGFPGVPLKIVRPETDLTLVESIQKKARFLVRLTAALELDRVRVVAQRAERLRDVSFDILFSRASGRIGQVAPVAARLLNDGGKVVFFKGPDFKAELTGAAAALAKHGLKVEKVTVVRSPVADRPVGLVLIGK